MKRFFGIVFFFCAIFFAGSFVYAQTAQPASEADLQARLAEIEKEQAALQQSLDDTRQQTATIQRDTNILTTEIKQAQLNIKAKNLNIAQLGKDIDTKTQHITDLTGQIEQGKQSLAQIIRKLNDIDAFSLPEIILAKQNLSEALIDIDSFSSVNRSLEDLFNKIRDTKATTEKEKAALDTKRDAELDAKKAIEADQRAVEKKEAEKKKLLALSKQKEVTYASVILAREQEAQKIRTALFDLRDTSGIQFGDAYQYAKQVSQKTGVRPAFLLAILTQESSLGKNVGSCLMTDLSTGAGKGKNTGTIFEKVMKPPRDTEPFKLITNALGRDWSVTPVSCPIGGAKYYVGRGFGGAMGPAQFIPSTWMLFENRLEKALGISQADPWKPLDAFMASGIYLGDLGAGAANYSSEIRAACKYYGSGGTSCTYGNQVMAKAANIQENMIDVLENN